MKNFTLFASPWWVNLLFLLPFIAYYFWRNKLNISSRILWLTGIFATAFGFVEAAVVVYLRAAGAFLGNMPLTASISPPTQVLVQLSGNLVNIEIVREAATMIMLICVALLAAKTKRERWAVYFWTFALWDIFYYIGLFLFIGWPQSLTTQDVLFLIPVPWYSQVWFPMLVSWLFVAVVLLRKKKRID